MSKEQSEGILLSQVYSRSEAEQWFRETAEKEDVFSHWLLVRLAEKGQIESGLSQSLQGLLSPPPFYRREGWTKLFTAISFLLLFGVPKMTTKVYYWGGGKGMLFAILFGLLGVIGCTYLIFNLTRLSEAEKEKRHQLREHFRSATIALGNLALRLMIDCDRILHLSEASLKQLADLHLKRQGQFAERDQREFEAILLSRKDALFIKAASDRPIASKSKLMADHEFFASLGLTDREWDDYWPRTAKPSKADPPNPETDGSRSSGKPLSEGMGFLTGDYYESGS